MPTVLWILGLKNWKRTSTSLIVSKKIIPILDPKNQRFVSGNPKNYPVLLTGRAIDYLIKIIETLKRKKQFEALVAILSVLNNICFTDPVGIVPRDRAKRVWDGSPLETEKAIGQAKKEIMEILEAA